MIEVHGLTKLYGEHAAIRDLSFGIQEGEVIGFLGLNGAGKSTTLRILGCVLLPTSGRVVIDGLDAATQAHEVRQRIGFLPDTPPLYEEMEVGEYLAFVAALRGVASAKVRARVEAAEEKTALKEVHRAPISSLSHGYRQRVGVAQALVHEPSLLILDEPTSGLDPVQIIEMRALVRSLKGEHTVLVSSHILPEISQVCDRLLVIHRGELVAQGTEGELAGRLGAGASAVELEVRGAAAPAVELLRGVPGAREVTVVAEVDGVATLRVAGDGELRGASAKALVSGGHELLRLDRSAHQLESIFLQLTREVPRS